MRSATGPAAASAGPRSSLVAAVVAVAAAEWGPDRVWDRCTGPWWSGVGKSRGRAGSCTVVTVQGGLGRIPLSQLLPVAVRVPCTSHLVPCTSHLLKATQRKAARIAHSVRPLPSVKKKSARKEESSLPQPAKVCHSHAHGSPGFALQCFPCARERRPGCAHGKCPLLPSGNGGRGSGVRGAVLQDPSPLW